MFKNLFSKSGDRQKDDNHNTRTEKKDSDPFVTEFLGNTEEYNLSTVQDRIEQSLHLIDDNPNEAIRMMRGNCFVLYGMLATSRQTYTSDKLMFILSSTYRIVQCLLKLKDYPEAVKEIETVNFLRHDAMTLYPSHWNILLSACNLSCQLVEINLKLGKFKEEDVKEPLEIIAMLELCANNMSRKCSMCRTIEHTADILFDNGYYGFAGEFYRYAHELFTQEELIAYRDQASNLGRYNVCLLNDKKQDIGQFEDSFREEIELFTKMRTEYNNDCRSLMDLAIAHGHYAEYHSLQGNTGLMLDELTEKIALNTWAYTSEKSVYTNEQIEQSALNSIQAVIKECDDLPETNKTEPLRLCAKCLSIFIGHNSSNIQIYSYANYIAMELFMIYKGNDHILAAEYLFLKISHLCILFEQYGAEKGIISDMVDTYEQCVDFIKQNESSLTDEQHGIWRLYIQQLSSCLK